MWSRTKTSQTHKKNTCKSALLLWLSTYSMLLFWISSYYKLLSTLPLAPGLPPTAGCKSTADWNHCYQLWCQWSHHIMFCVQFAIHVTWWNYWPHKTFVDCTVKAMRTSAVTYRLVWLTFLLDQLRKIAQKQKLSQLSASANCYNQEKVDQNLSGSKLHDWGMQTEGEVRDKSITTRQNNPLCNVRPHKISVTEPSSTRNGVVSRAHHEESVPRIW
jgi:hypothetical protein